MALPEDGVAPGKLEQIRRPGELGDFVAVETFEKRQMRQERLDVEASLFQALHVRERIAIGL
jgi:hypothetical protein